MTLLLGLIIGTLTVTTSVALLWKYKLDDAKYAIEFAKIPKYIDNDIKIDIDNHLTHLTKSRPIRRKNVKGSRTPTGNIPHNHIDSMNIR